LLGSQFLGLSLSLSLNLLPQLLPVLLLLELERRAPPFHVPESFKIPRLLLAKAFPRFKFLPDEKLLRLTVLLGGVGLLELLFPGKPFLLSFLFLKMLLELSFLPFEFLSGKILPLVRWLLRRLCHPIHSLRRQRFSQP
jgi:hypothetical protein